MNVSWRPSAPSRKLRTLVPLTALALILSASNSVRAQSTFPFGGGALTTSPLSPGYYCMTGSPQITFVKGKPTVTCSGQTTTPALSSASDFENDDIACHEFSKCGGFISAKLLGGAFTFKMANSVFIALFEPAGAPNTSAGGIMVSQAEGTGLLTLPPSKQFPNGITIPSIYIVIYIDDDSATGVLGFDLVELETQGGTEVWFSTNNQIEVNSQPITGSQFGSPTKLAQLKAKWQPLIDNLLRQAQSR